MECDQRIDQYEYDLKRTTAAAIVLIMREFRMKNQTTCTPLQSKSKGEKITHRDSQGGGSVYVSGQSLGQAI